MDYCYKGNSRWSKVVYIIFGVATIILAYGMLISDLETSGKQVSGFWWHRIPPIIFILLLFFCTFLLIYEVIRERNAKADNQIFLGLYYAVMSVVYAGTVVYLNVFAGDLYHIDAYMHPIYSVFYNTPYSSVSYSLYGHYELFYKIPMLVFGTSPTVICVVLGGIACAQEWITLCIINKLIKSRVIKIVAPIAMLVPTGCMFVSSSYQSTPHRVIFPIILIYYGLKCADVQEFDTKAQIRGNIICTLSFIWNTETGAVCCIAWFAYCIVRTLQKVDVGFGGLCKQICMGMGFFAADVFFAILYVNIYNFCVGGEIFIKEYFYPFINGGFMEHYNISLLFDNVPYMYVYILALGTITYGISKTFLFQKEAYCKIAAPIVLAGTLLLGQLLYYVTRATYYGLLITFPVAFILICFFADTLIRKNSCYISIYESIKRSIGGISVSCIAALLCMSGILGWKYADSFSVGRYDIVDYKEELAEFKKSVEKDTYAVGWGTDEIYGALGWDTGYHMLGTTDVLADPDANRNIYDLLCEEVNNKDKVVLSTAAYQLVDINYRMINEFQVLGGTYGYFEKSEYNKSAYIQYGASGLQVKFQKDNERRYDGYLRISGYVYGISDIDLNEIELALRNTSTGAIYKIDTYIQSCAVVPEVLKELQDIELKKLYARVLVDDLNIDADTWEIVLIQEKENIKYFCTGVLINR